MSVEGKITVIHWATVDYPPGEMTPVSIKMADLFREFADWIEEVGPHAIEATGTFGHPTKGSITWRREP